MTNRFELNDELLVTFDEPISEITAIAFQPPTEVEIVSITMGLPDDQPDSN